MLPRLIEEQSKGLQGLNPKINIWNTGGGQGGKISSVLDEFFKTGIPMMEQIRDQTGKDILGSLGINTSPSSCKGPNSGKCSDPHLRKDGKWCKECIEDYNNGKPQKNEYNNEYNNYGLPHNNS